MALVGLYGFAADQGRRCAVEPSQTTLCFFPQSLCRDWARLFLPGTAVRLHLVTPVLLPELHSLAVILLVWVLPRVPPCGYNLHICPCLMARKGWQRLRESEESLGFCHFLSSFLWYSRCHNQCQRLLPREMCKTSVHRPKDWLLGKMSAICSRLCLLSYIWHRISHLPSEMQMLKWSCDRVSLSLAPGVPWVNVCSEGQAIYIYPAAIHSKVLSLNCDTLQQG